MLLTLLSIDYLIIALPVIEKLIGWLQSFGAAGLFVLTLLDSALIPTAGTPDVLLLVLATNGQPITAAIAAIVGSTIGCIILYYMSRAAGEAALGRFGTARRDRAKELLDKYDVLAVLISAILPPPFPFKIFVISSGVFRLRLLRFTVAIVIGRTFRFSLLALAGYRYGAQAKEMFRANYPMIGLGLALTLIGGLLLYKFVMRLKRRRTLAPGPNLEEI